MSSVVPAQAGIQFSTGPELGPGLRRGDDAHCRIRVQMFCLLNPV